VSESSRVENSPAVEQCPPWEMPSSLATTITNNRENGKGISKRGFLFGATARLCRKDKEEQKKEAKEKKETNKSKVKGTFFGWTHRRNGCIFWTLAYFNEMRR
jgi:hypothetical protein